MKSLERRANIRGAVVLPRHTFTRCAFANSYSQQTSQVASLLFLWGKEAHKGDIAVL